MVKVLSELQVPLVGVGADAEKMGIPMVDVDNYAGGRLATEHLISLGHKKIAHISGTLSKQASADMRKQAYVESMKNAGIPVRSEYLVDSEYEANLAAEDTRRLMRLPDPPTAIFAANDFIASHAIRVAEDLGFSVPEQLSVVGYDNNPLSDAVPRPLTTIHQPVVEIGRLATELLMSRINGEAVDVRTYLLEPQLIVRGTSAPPNRD
jgi:LacI family transcriptional regulator